ncbi:branched-chain amino acid ABC transporter permease [Dactylosporangium sp. CS-033363]|uniref:branched-chain amino acid ABC transporter permease n=1 Tax=Dactylosporangium sp. CS-033363 TaxID=3239935 RepID=UPI003D8BD2CE
MTTRPRPWYFSLRGAALLALVLVAVTGFVNYTQLDYSIFLYNTFLLTCIGALAMNLLMGTTGLVSVGSAGFLAAGAFTAVWCDRAGLPFPLCLLIGGLVSAVLGLVVALPAIRLRGLALGLGTISVHFVVVFAVDQYQQRTPGAGVVGFTLPPVFGTTVGVQYQWAWLLCAFVLATIALTGLIGSGRTGRALRLMRDQEAIAGTLAVPVTGYKMMTFAVTAFLFGVQGALTAYLTGQVGSDQFTLTIAMQYLAMVMVGGLDSAWGAAIGAAIFTALPFWMQDLVSAALGSQQASLNGAKYGVIAYAVLVVVFIVGAPAGLAGLGRDAWSKLAARRRGSTP